MSSFKRKDIVLRPRASFGVLSHHIENRVDAEKSHVKTMLVPFLDSGGIPQGTSTRGNDERCKVHCNVDPFRETSKAGYDPGTRNKVRGFLVQDDARPTYFLANEGGVCANRSSAVLAGSRSCSLLPIPTTRTRFEKERDSKKFPTSDKT